MTFRYPVVWKGDLVDLSGSDSDGELGRRGYAIRALVNHRIVGSLESAIAEFTDQSTSGQSRRVASHFGLGYLGTRLTVVQFVALENTAYCNGQSPDDRAACTWPLWIRLSRPPTNQITVSFEHEDNGAVDGGDGAYVVAPEIVEMSIALQRLLLTGDGPVIRAAGIRCSDAAAAQLRAIEPSTETVIDHHVCAPVSKPYCWRPIGADEGFPQARYLAALSAAGSPTEDDMAKFIQASAFGDPKWVKAGAKVYWLNGDLAFTNDGVPDPVTAVGLADGHSNQMYVLYGTSSRPYAGAAAYPTIFMVDADDTVVRQVAAPAPVDCSAAVASATAAIQELLAQREAQIARARQALA